MKCVVSGCPNNSRRDKHVGYFTFPKDETLLKQWMKFCKLEKRPKAHKVCMEHFEADQIQGNMKFELGFGKKRYLKKDAVPTIRCPNKKSRLERLDRRNNKKLVYTLIREYSTEVDETEYSEESSIPFLGDTNEHGIEEDIGEDMKTEVESEIEEGLTDEEEEIERAISEEVVKLDMEMAKAAELENVDIEAEIEEAIDISDNEDHITIYEDEVCPVEGEEYTLQDRIETLERENKILRQENTLLDERLSSIERRYKYELNELKDKLEQVERDKKVLESQLNDIMAGRTIICTQIQQM